MGKHSDWSVRRYKGFCYICVTFYCEVTLEFKRIQNESSDMRKSNADMSVVLLLFLIKAALATTSVYVVTKIIEIND